ncbi:ribosomal protein L11 methyltransferase [Agaricicola taiwanensis]|uniref:Ribosomal protein L11 methyltransferase n=1 Tax=Agaricicola taiwanensis TaxID=591372 RepID=A0A8J2YFI7_9RHOB|nr:50S ribosomal protein L11 methyltransferase [Agaricicola taiwanensis]GGE42452.1 ribosomal protein L11 methyltransferase [Agaricicola taiwanensis]
MPTAVVRFHAPTKLAHRLSNVLEETLSLEENTVATFEDPQDESRWTVEIYSGPMTEPNELLQRVNAILGDDAKVVELQADSIEDADWVAASLEGLAPVRAGRFFVHGGHDSHRVPANALGIRVEAALAFGTGHHGTTLGCLLALDDVLKREQPAKVLDLGTGTGVLAIAVAKALKRAVLATDIDPVSVRITRENAHLNRVGHLVKTEQADGFGTPIIAQNAPFDLILANILARPLMALSTGMVQRTRSGGTIILSGLLVSQERMVLASYAAQGMRLIARRHIDNWATLVLRRGRG